MRHPLPAGRILARMDTARLPADDAADALLGRTRHLLGWLIGELAAALVPEAGPKALRWAARHLLAPAEALMRRALRLIAAGLPAPAPKRPALAHATRPAPAPSAPRKARAPVFRLMERLPRPAALAAPLPRITDILRAPARAVPPQPLTTTNPRAALERLQRRVEALRAAWLAPLPLARRLQRRLAANSGAPKLTLAYLRPPGARTRALGPDGAAIFRDINDAALAAELGRADTS